MEALHYFNITIEFWNFLFLILSIIFTIIGIHTKKQIKKYLVKLFLCFAVILLSEIFSLFGIYFLDLSANVLLFLLAFTGKFFSYLLSFIFLSFLVYLVRYFSDTDDLRFADHIFFSGKIIFLFSTVILCLSQFNGILYYFDEKGICHPGTAWFLSFLIIFSFLVADTSLLVRYRNLFVHKCLILLYFCIMFPLAGVILQFYFSPVKLIHFSCTLSALMLLIFVFRLQTIQYTSKEQKITDMQSAVLVSQIQPHFLHNSLVSIAQLCENDPRTAKTAIITFSEYLRGNMDSLKENAPIPFTKELEHLKHYFYLEKMRFGHYLDIVLDIQAVNFKIPVLSLQPLVENAVRHGVGMREDGGKIVISSREYFRYFEICISDNGVGFDPKCLESDGKQHIGIKNVRDRLKTMCNGTLVIHSVPDKGTTVTIHIPKEVI